MTHMAREAAEAPEAVQRFLTRNAAALAGLGARLRAAPPPVILTAARGSSDHAAHYFKYLAEILFGIPCASVGASVVSIYGSRLRVEGALSLTISQSGQSPDIVALQNEARRAGAYAVALINTEESPAARAADLALPLLAGAELSVAATKSCIAAMAAGAAIAAHWLGDGVLLKAVADLPEMLARAAARPVVPFTAAESLYVLGRGPAYPVAQETALKLKETCALHAEAYSFAEVMHGPLELVGEGFPVIAYLPADAARQTNAEAIARLNAAGASVAVSENFGGHPLLEPIAMLQSAYLAIEATARALGRDPDRPRLLKKVTETV